FITYPACKGTLPFRFSSGKWQQTEEPPGDEILSLASTVSGSLDRETSKEATDISEEPSFGGFRLLEDRVNTDSKESQGHFFPVPPLPDFAAEEKEFLDWKENSLFGSLGLVFAGMNALLLTLPKLA